MWKWVHCVTVKLAEEALVNRSILLLTPLEFLLLGHIPMQDTPTCNLNKLASSFQ
jgi:hypothetical protein